MQSKYKIILFYKFYDLSQVTEIICALKEIYFVVEPLIQPSSNLLIIA